MSEDTGNLNQFLDPFQLERARGVNGASGQELYKALEQVGFIFPKNVGDMTVVIPVDGVVVLKIDVVLDGMQLAQLSAALLTLSQG